MNKNVFENFSNKNLFLFLTFFFIICISLIPSTSILGIWESYTFYYNFAALEAPFDFRIPFRSNQSNPAVFSLGATRIIHDFFEIFPSLKSYRMLSSIYGIITLFLFFIISKRWFGFIPALIATALLSINPLFQMQQHTMTQVMVSALVFLLLIERLQNLEFNYTSNIAWLSLGISFTLLIFHYVPVIIFSLIFILFWLLKFFLLTKSYPNGYLFIKKISNKFFFALTFFFLLTVILNWKNLFSLIQFYNIILPTDAEVLFNPMYSSISADIFTSIKINSHLLLESLTGFGNAYHGNTPSYLRVDVRYPILNPILFIFFIAGVIISARNLKKKNLLFSMPYLSSLILFLVCLIPLFTSSVFIYDEANQVNLNQYRTFYLLFPSYLLATVSFKFIFDRVQKKYKLNFFIFLGFFLFVSLGVKNIIDENYKFNNKLNLIDHRLSGLEALNLWSDNTMHTNKKFKMHTNVTVDHMQLHSHYYNIAKKVHENLKINQNNNFYILNLNLDKFQKIKRFRYKKLNYNPIFFSLYLNNFGIKSAWIQIIDENEPKHVLGKTYMPYKFSATLVKENEKVQYKDTSRLKAYLRHVGSKIPHIIITTTEEELNFAKNFFEKNDIKDYSLLNI